MFVCGLAQYEEYKKLIDGGSTVQEALLIFRIFFLCMTALNSVKIRTETDESIQVISHESDARDCLEQATEICLYGKVSTHSFKMRKIFC